MKISYKPLWKQLIDKDLKKRICVNWQESVLPLSPRWVSVAM